AGEPCAAASAAPNSSAAPSSTTHELLIALVSIALLAPCFALHEYRAPAIAGICRPLLEADLELHGRPSRAEFAGPNGDDALHVVEQIERPRGRGQVVPFHRIERRRRAGERDRVARERRATRHLQRAA